MALNRKAKAKRKGRNERKTVPETPIKKRLLETPMVEEKPKRPTPPPRKKKIEEKKVQKEQVQSKEEARVATDLFNAPEEKQDEIATDVLGKTKEPKTVSGLIDAMDSDVDESAKTTEYKKDDVSEELKNAQEKNRENETEKVEKNEKKESTFMKTTKKYLSEIGLAVGGAAVTALAALDGSITGLLGGSKIAHYSAVGVLAAAVIATITGMIIEKKNEVEK